MGVVLCVELSGGRGRRMSYERMGHGLQEIGDGWDGVRRVPASLQLHICQAVRKVKIKYGGLIFKCSRPGAVADKEACDQQRAFSQPR